MFLTVVWQEICDLFLSWLFYSNIFLTSLAKSRIYFKSGFICCWKSCLQMLFTEEKNNYLCSFLHFQCRVKIFILHLTNKDRIEVFFDRAYCINKLSNNIGNTTLPATLLCFLRPFKQKLRAPIPKNEDFKEIGHWTFLLAQILSYMFQQSWTK